MISTKLLERVKTHWEAIAAAVIEQSRSDPHTPHHQELDSEELHARAHELLEGLGEWLTTQDPERITRRCEEIGRQRFSEGRPLAEVVYKVYMIELKTVEYMQYTNIAQTATEMFGEMEMLRALHRFFAIVVYSFVRGYEQAAAGSIWSAQKQKTHAL
jgi:hypothetical protein